MFAQKRMMNPSKGSAKLEPAQLGQLRWQSTLHLAAACFKSPVDVPRWEVGAEGSVNCPGGRLGVTALPGHRSLYMGPSGCFQNPDFPISLAGGAYLGTEEVPHQRLRPGEVLKRVAPSVIAIMLFVQGCATSASAMDITTIWRMESRHQLGIPRKILQQCISESPCESFMVLVRKHGAQVGLKLPDLDRLETPDGRRGICHLNPQETDPVYHVHKIKRAG